MRGVDTSCVHREDGFTLLEMLAVLIIMSILTAVAVASYTGARVRTNDAAAKSNIDVAVPAFQAYYLDNGTYVGMTLARLQSRYSRGVRNITIVSTSASSYCVRSTVSGRSWYKAGPSARITTTRCR
jgi:prepilin-type N-terminal cleavage/methylation domain-containing protein